MVRSIPRKRYKQAIAITLVLVVILAVLHHAADEPVFVGEVWGDLESTGDVVGINEFESSIISISMSGPSTSNDSLLVEISNISSVSMWYMEAGEKQVTNYTLHNRSLMINTSSRGFFSTNYLVDAQIVYQLREFSGFWVDEFTYSIHFEAESVEGSARMPHDPDDDRDFTVDWDTFVFIDNITLTNRWAHYEIPEEEVADIHITGSGNLRFGSHPEVHIDGSLTIEDFRARKGSQIVPRYYDRVRIEGDDIIVRTKASPRYDDFKGHEYWDPWIIEIDASEGRDVEVQSRLALSTVVAYLVIMVAGAVLVVFAVSLRRGLPPRPSPIEMEWQRRG